MCHLHKYCPIQTNTVPFRQIFRTPDEISSPDVTNLQINTTFLQMPYESIEVFLHLQKFRSADYGIRQVCLTAMKRS